MSDVTRILGRVQAGEPKAAEELLPLVYDELLAVHDALEQLAHSDPTSAELVKLRYFAGLSMPEAAEALHLPLRTAERMWTFAKAWLRKTIGESKA